MSRDQFTRRSEASLRALSAQTNHDRRAADKLEAEIMVELLIVLARPASVPGRPTVVGGRWNFIGVLNSYASHRERETASGHGADKRA
jgi:hypothetical protein